jgi:hypothetical protein
MDLGQHGLQDCSAGGVAHRRQLPGPALSKVTARGRQCRPARIGPGSTRESRTSSTGGSSPMRSPARVRDGAARAGCLPGWPFCSSHGTVSAANELAGSQVGSQCRQAPGDIRPHRARVLAARRHAGRLLALSGGGPGLYGMQEVRGSNPLRSTIFHIPVRSKKRQSNDNGAGFSRRSPPE